MTQNFTHIIPAPLILQTKVLSCFVCDFRQEQQKWYLSWGIQQLCYVCNVIEKTSITKSNDIIVLILGCVCVCACVCVKRQSLGLLVLFTFLTGIQKAIN